MGGASQNGTVGFDPQPHVHSSTSGWFDKCQLPPPGSTPATLADPRASCRGMLRGVDSGWGFDSGAGFGARTMWENTHTHTHS